MVSDNTVTITGVWVRRSGDKVQLLAEYQGRWRLLCEEFVEGPFSHIVEGRAVADRPLDPVTESSPSSAIFARSLLERP